MSDSHYPIYGETGALDGEVYYSAGAPGNQPKHKKYMVCPVRMAK